MTHSNENYKGFTIKQRNDIPSYNAIIHKGETIIKCIAGDVREVDNSIEKAKQFIDANLIRQSNNKKFSYFTDNFGS